jgi:hypothetical protein
VISWRSRYRPAASQGLRDEARSRRPRTVGRREVIAVGLQSSPRRFGVTHWPSRLLARHLDISDHTALQAWGEHGVQRCRSESFRFSADPEPP